MVGNGMNQSLGNGNARTLMLHMHFPKTGGTTLSKIFTREFGGRHCHLSFFVPKAIDGSKQHITWRDVGTKHPVSTLEPDWHFDENDLFAAVKQHDDAVVISRHGMIITPSTIETMKDADRPCRIVPIFFMRKFFPWHASLYFQQRRDPEYMVRLSRDPEVMVAKTGSFVEYTKYCVSNRDSLGRHKPMYNWSDSHVEAMLGSVKSYQFGLVERYDESLVVIEDALRECFPKLDLSYARPHNVGKTKEGALASHVGKLRARLDARLAERLGSMGEKTDNLHAKLNGELDARISRIPDFDTKMADFSDRCKSRCKAEP